MNSNKWFEEQVRRLIQRFEREIRSQKIKRGEARKSAHAPKSRAR